MVRRSELVVIAVPHDQLEGLVVGLAELGAWQPGQLVLHTDPAFGTGVLAPAAAKGAIPLAVHPAIAFTGTSIDRRQLTGAYAAVTAPAAGAADRAGARGRARLRAGRRRRGGPRRVRRGRSPPRPSSRARSCGQAAALLRQAGVPNPGAYLSALAHSTIDHALADAGSAARGRAHRYDQRMISTIDGLRTRLAEARAAAPDGARIALISTIGALHDGHIDLVHRAREVADIVVVSVFVNPLRFANAAEFEAYPRTPDDDERLLASLGVDIVFAPDDGRAAARTARTRPR